MIETLFYGLLQLSLITFKNSLQAPGIVEPVTDVTPLSVTACGGDLQAGQTLTYPSPAKGGHYSNNEHCIWTVTAPAGQLVQAKLIRFKLDDSQIEDECSDDYLKISTGGGTEFGNLCGDYTDWLANRSPTDGRLISLDNKLRLEFHTDGKITDEGFSIEFSAVDPENPVRQHFTNFDMYYVKLHYGLKNTGIFKGQVEQLLHEPGITKNVTVMLTKSCVSLKGFTFSTPPDWNWVIKRDGIYRQDGSKDLRNTRSTRPDYLWPKLE